jgi:DNA-binding NtrC family response regulator
VVSIKIPPLRERKEDIPELVSYFIKRFNRELKKRIAGITSQAMEKMASYGWPGNVRQLENVLKRAMVLCQGEWISEDQLLIEGGWEPSNVKASEGPLTKWGKRSIEDLLDLVFEELSKGTASSQELDMISTIERELILRALQKTKGNQLQAALLLGINRSTLRGKMERYHIKKEVLVSENEN